jgi:hypothetical protein
VAVGAEIVLIHSPATRRFLVSDTSSDYAIATLAHVVEGRIVRTMHLIEERGLELWKSMPHDV